MFLHSVPATPCLPWERCKTLCSVHLRSLVYFWRNPAIYITMKGLSSDILHLIPLLIFFHFSLVYSKFLVGGDGSDKHPKISVYASQWSNHFRHNLPNFHLKLKTLATAVHQGWIEDWRNLTRDRPTDLNVSRTPKVHTCVRIMYTSPHTTTLAGARCKANICLSVLSPVIVVITRVIIHSIWFRLSPWKTTQILTYSAAVDFPCVKFELNDYLQLRD